ATPLAMRGLAWSATGQFKLAVITDEITQDLDHALAVARDMGLQHVELRTMWSKTLMDWKDNDVQEARRLLEKYGMTVTDIASPYLKVDAPHFKTHFGERDRFGYKEQSLILDRAIELAKAFRTDKIRVFSFWRVEPPSTVFDLVIAELK